MKINFAKVKEEAIIPSKREEDAGYDIYACFKEDYIIIPPHTTQLIPTGIASSCSKDYAFILRERGSTGSKGLGLRCGVIDSGYRNEWFVGLTNHNDFPYAIVKNGKEQQLIKEYELSKKNEESTVDIKLKIYPYEKAIAQALVLAIPLTEVEELSYNELQKISSERGMGALGSTEK